MKIGGHRRQRPHRNEARNRLRDKGHEAVPASPSSGVNIVTGEGLAETLAGAQIAVDIANSPSFEDKVALGAPANGTDWPQRTSI